MHLPDPCGSGVRGQIPSVFEVSRLTTFVVIAFTSYVCGEFSYSTTPAHSPACRQDGNCCFDSGDSGAHFGVTRPLPSNETCLFVDWKEELKTRLVSYWLWMAGVHLVRLTFVEIVTQAVTQGLHDRNGLHFELACKSVVQINGR